MRGAADLFFPLLALSLVKDARCMPPAVCPSSAGADAPALRPFPGALRGGFPARLRSGLVGAIVLSAGTLSGCVAPAAVGVAEGGNTRLARHSTAATASLGTGDVLSGSPAAINAFCDALVPWRQRAFTYRQSARLYETAAGYLDEAKGKSGDPDLLAAAVHSSCAARFGFERLDDLGFEQRDELAAWNDNTMAQALLLLGQTNAHLPTLKLALMASSAAADGFSPAQEGWGWSRYNLGQSAHAVWRLENAEPYLAKTVAALQQVVGRPSLPPELLRSASLELAGVLTAGHGHPGGGDIAKTAETGRTLPTAARQGGAENGTRTILGGLGQ
jgi:hypothetical protein